MAFIKNTNIPVPLLPSSAAFADPSIFNVDNEIYQTLLKNQIRSNDVRSISNFKTLVQTIDRAPFKTIDPKDLNSSVPNYTYYNESMEESSDEEIAEPTAMLGCSLDDDIHRKESDWTMFQEYKVSIQKWLEENPFHLKDYPIFNSKPNPSVRPLDTKRSASTISVSQDAKLTNALERETKRRKSEVDISTLTQPMIQPAASATAPATPFSINKEGFKFEFKFGTKSAPVTPIFDDEGEEIGTDEDSDPKPVSGIGISPVNLSGKLNFQSSPSKFKLKSSDKLLAPIAKAKKGAPVAILETNTVEIALPPTDADEEEESDTEFEPKFDAPRLVRPKNILDYAESESDFDEKYDSEDESDSKGTLSSLSRVQHERAIIEQVQIKVVPTTYTPPSTSSSNTSGSTSRARAKSKRCKKSNVKITKQNKQFRPLEPGEIYYPCPKCPQFFRRPEHVKRHIRSVHTAVRPYKCHFCEKGFPRSDNLSQHLKTHMTLDEWERLKTGNSKADVKKIMKKKLGVR